MRFFDWVNSKIKRLDWLDVKLIKLGAFFLGLAVGAYFSEHVLPYWWAFVALYVLLHVRMWCRVFRK